MKAEEASEKNKPFIEAQLFLFGWFWQVGEKGQARWGRWMKRLARQARLWT